ncbi:hypothetical protein [Promicromonospora soli]
MLRSKVWAADDVAHVGGEVCGVEVAKATGVRSIGYAKTRQRKTELREAGAHGVEDADLLAVAPDLVRDDGE